MYQAFDRDRQNLLAAGLLVVGQVGWLAVVVALPIDAGLALFLAALGNGVVAGLVLLGRLRGIAKFSGVGGVGFALPGRVAQPGRLLLANFQAGIDGLVYFGVFFLASVVAAGQSGESGVAIATAVGIMRIVVIPLKQLGLVGGRPATVQSRDPLAPGGGRGGLSLLGFRACPSALGALPWAGLPEALVVLMGLQLMVEPIAGVLYAAVKVSKGPAVGLSLLFCVYLLGVVPALALLGLLQLGTPTAIWSVLLIARAVFALGTVRLARQDA